MVDEELTSKVIGCAMDVHRELGPGYLEKVYENALMIALREIGLAVGQQVAVPAMFHGVVVGDFVADLLVANRLIVELKAVTSLLPVHETQLVSYLKATGIDVGLLLNFGSSSLQIKRKHRLPKSLNKNRDDEICFKTGLFKTGLQDYPAGLQDYHVNPQNPVILSKTPTPHPANPSNPVILSKTNPPQSC